MLLYIETSVKLLVMTCKEKNMAYSTVNGLLFVGGGMGGGGDHKALNLNTNHA